MPATYNIGDKIQNRWEIHHILHGGMGEVYIVYDHQFRVPFAAKSFRPDLLKESPGLARRFQQEAGAWVKLDHHANVTRARFVEVIEGQPFLFLEYVSGGDLSKWIREGRLLGNLKQQLTFGIHFCDGMIHALSKGIGVHRDIKPQNCLITEDGTLKVTDFGLAKLFDGSHEVSGTDENALETLGALQVHLTRTGAMAGTYTHMAPEQWIDAKHVDLRADIYAFGVVLYEMAAGRLPFDGRSWERLKAQHEGERPQSIREPGLNEVIQTCLKKAPDQRYPNFTEVRERLARLYEEKGFGRPPQPATAQVLDAIDWSNKGASLANLGKTSEAIGCYEKALEINPRHAAAWFNKGIVLSGLGRPSEAIGCYEKALEINPRHAAAWTNKGDDLLALGRHQEAVGCYEKALEINPRHVGAWTNMGLCLGNLGRHKVAVDCYEKALEINPRYAEAWINKGNVLYALGRHSEAICCYEKVLEIDPLYAAAWFNKGIVLSGLGRPSEALGYYEKALEINPRYAAAWYNKGIALRALGRPSEALGCYEKALEINPLYAAAWTNKGNVLYALGRPSEALGCYEKALAINPRFAEAWSNNGNVLYALGRHSEALGCYEKALEINPRFAEAWSNKGSTLSALGRPSEALGCYEKALEINPRDAAAWTNKGNVLYALGRPSEALGCYEKALAINPRDADAWFNKGAIMANDIQDYKAALACFETADGLGHPNAANAIAICQEALGGG